MNPEQINALISAAQSISAVLQQLGVPGLLCLALAGPACVIVAMLWFDHGRAVRQEHQLAVYREDMEKQQKAFRETVERVLEIYRADTQNILRDVAGQHAEVVAYYRDNVKLVREDESVASALQSIIVNNTRAVERLITIIETRERP